jgi:hypothetical protein
MWVSKCSIGLFRKQKRLMNRQFATCSFIRESLSGVKAATDLAGRSLRLVNDDSAIGPFAWREDKACRQPGNVDRLGWRCRLGSEVASTF